MFAQFDVTKVFLEKQSTEMKGWKIRIFLRIDAQLSHSLRYTDFTESTCSRYFWTNARPLFPLFWMSYPIVPKSAKATSVNVILIRKFNFTSYELTLLAISPLIHSTSPSTASNLIQGRNRFDRAAQDLIHRYWPLCRYHSMPIHTTAMNRSLEAHVSQGNNRKSLAPH